jgi:hypothetical protein
LLPKKMRPGPKESATCRTKGATESVVSAWSWSLWTTTDTLASTLGSAASSSIARSQ